MIRARDLGIPFKGLCGVYNAITDVKGIEVGFSTIIRGEPSDDTTTISDFARTGVTCILPRGKKRSAVFAGRYDLNGNGELTGTHWIDDSGFLHGPIMITNTNSVGVVRDATAKWMIKHNFYYPIFRDDRVIEGAGYFYPTVGETYDGVLNNINGFMVKEENAFEALNSAKAGFVEEGNVGGGTGMRCHSFKGGTGTSSRIIKLMEGDYTLGVLVQANHGIREDLKISGIPFGREIKGHEQIVRHLAPKPGDGSIIVVVATDAPFMPWQLAKICKRIPIGIGNLGGGFQNNSGDIFIAFSTANEEAFGYSLSTIEMLSDEKIDPFYKATIEAVEEAIVNAMVAAESMYGRNNNFLPALPHDQVKRILKKYAKFING